MCNLALYPSMEWRGRFAVLLDQAEKEQLRLYAYDLLWLSVKERYRNLPQPSKLAHSNVKKQDTRSAEDIKQYLLKRFREVRESYDTDGTSRKDNT